MIKTGKTAAQRYKRAKRLRSHMLALRAFASMFGKYGPAPF